MKGDCCSGVRRDGRRYNFPTVIRLRLKGYGATGRPPTQVQTEAGIASVIASATASSGGAGSIETISNWVAP